MKKGWKLLLLTLLWRADFLAVDRCLDAGGCWDETTHRCEFHDASRCEAPRAD